MKNLIVASTSTLFGENYLEYLLEDLKIFYQNTSEILFIPYARPGGILHDEYTQIVQEAFYKIDKKIVGLHTFEDPKNAISQSKGIFVGGGNTFVLTQQLYKYDLWEVLKSTINKGIPYLGTSAGSNICGLSIQNTNDMPIVVVPSYSALGIFPFNLNPHYLDIDTNSKHNGETRETRIKEFFAFNNIPVLGLREGSFLRILGDEITLRGKLNARLFTNSDIKELEPNSDLSYIK
ncbi:MAG: dipeptidase PepE [Flavobacterium sp.]